MLESALVYVSFSLYISPVNDLHIYSNPHSHEDFVQGIDVDSANNKGVDFRLDSDEVWLLHDCVDFI